MNSQQAATATQLQWLHSSLAVYTGMCLISFSTISFVAIALYTFSVVVPFAIFSIREFADKAHDWPPPHRDCASPAKKLRQALRPTSVIWVSVSHQQAGLSWAQWDLHLWLGGHRAFLSWPTSENTVSWFSMLIVSVPPLPCVRINARMDK